jgi:glycosyltransferase involved in cell wall biosynthesis
MISILIPVYNRNVIPLVTDLQRQGIESGIPFDILVADDASDQEAIKAGNASLDLLPYVRCHTFSQNIGVRSLRQEMAAMATYPNLLLIDSDAVVEDERYLLRYMQLADGKTVVFGGIVYPEEPRRDNLRWWYGINRECAPADKSNRRPGGFLTTFNLLIPRDIFMKASAEMSGEWEAMETSGEWEAMETSGEWEASAPPPGAIGQLSGYGHEDTLLGMQLERDGVRVLHINNPLLHTGLPDNETFLRQTESGVSNLLVLYRSFEPLSLLRKRSRLIRLFEWLRRLGLLRIYSVWFSRNESGIRRQLLSSTPSLRKMDVYKLGKLVRLYLQTDAETFAS